MTTEPTVPKESALVEYSEDTKYLVNQNMPNESDQVKNETMALIEAIKRRAQSEAKGAGDLTRETYLTAVRQTREAIEQLATIPRFNEVTGGSGSAPSLRRPATDWYSWTMVTTRRITFRLYPNRQQEKTLHYWRRLHCGLYNAAVYNRKTQYQKFGHSVNYLEQQNCLPEFKEVLTEYKPLGSHALQATLKRVDFAFVRFFKGLGGHPKFKASRRYSGWTYPCSSAWKAGTDGKNGHLSITNLGKIQMRGQARTWGIPTTCTVMFCDNKRYAAITVQCVPTRTTETNSVGIDLGCKDAITLSTGIKIAKPDFIREGQTKVKLASKKLRRKRSPSFKKKVKASRRWKKERTKVSQLQRKVTHQREDWLHKTTSNIVSSNSLVAGEELNVKGMTAKAKKGKRKAQKSGLNRSILDVGFGMIGKMLDYKLAEAGGFYVESPTRSLKPTQRCAKCWEITPKTLADRIHLCSNPNCGHTEDRDVNAAQVNLIYARGLEQASLDGESSSSTLCGSMRQLGAKKRQKRLLSGSEVGNSDFSASKSE